MAAAMPGGSVFFEDMKSDLPSVAHVRRVLKFHLEDDFPARSEDLVVDIAGFRKTSGKAMWALVAGAPRGSVEERVRLLSVAGFAPDLLDADACALHTVAARALPETAGGPRVLVYVAETHMILAITDKGRLLLARNLAFPTEVGGDPGAAPAADRLAPHLARETEMMWRSVFRRGVPASASLVIGGEPDLTQGLAGLLDEALGCRVAELRPFDAVAANRGDSDAGLALALGLALRAASAESEGLNLLAAGAQKGGRAARIRREVAVTAALAFAIALVWLGGRFHRRRVHDV